jgi:hypothetical protein
VAQPDLYLRAFGRAISTNGRDLCLKIVNPSHKLFALIILDPVVSTFEIIALRITVAIACRPDPRRAVS